VTALNRSTVKTTARPTETKLCNAARARRDFDSDRSITKGLYRMN
jgi:hypothetical protein